MTNTAVLARNHDGPTALGDEARFFVSHLNPRIMAGCLAVALAARVWVGRWGLADLVVVAALVAAEPLVEWLIHVFVLHWRPRRILGRKIDPLVSRKHREHHQDPKKTEWIFVPLPVLVKVIPAATLLYLVLLPLHLALTALSTALTIFLVYEWTHYLIHSRYRPRSRLYRYIWRAHRLHHFKNENYWFGVTMHAADHVLGTFPAKDEVETSATCRTLGVSPTSL